MNYGINFYSFLNIFFGIVNIFYGIGIACYYFLKYSIVKNPELFNDQIKNMILDPIFLFFNIEYSMHIQICIGVVFLIFGLFIFFIWRNTNKKINSKDKLMEKKIKSINVIFILFIIEFLFFSFFYLLRAISLQFGGIV